ncbi:hypothetical protein D3C77_513470 [compost metagenome]
MFVTIEAAQPDAAWQTIDLFHPKLAVVIDCVEIAISDVTDRILSGVNAYSGAVAQDWKHAVSAYGYAIGFVELDAVFTQALLRKPQPSAVINLNTKAANARSKLHFLQKGDRDLVVIDWRLLVPGTDSL